MNHWNEEWDFHHHLAVCYLDYCMQSSDILEIQDLWVCASNERLERNGEVTHFHTFQCPDIRGI